MTKQPQSPDSSRDALMYRVGYLQSTADRTQATCERILAIVSTGTKSTELPTASGLMAKLWQAIKETGNGAILVWRLWDIWRKVSWPVSIPLYLFFAAKWLGLF